MCKGILRVVVCGLLLLAVGMLGFVLGALSLGGYSPNMLLELLGRETPQARVETYLKAIQAGEREAALAAWTLPAPSSPTFPALEERRSQVTDTLLALGMAGFTIFEPEWWGTCCDPGITCQARNAGGARLRVQVLDAQGKPWGYVFDVFIRGVYFGDAEGNPYRHWFLRDVYPRGEQPLFWTLPSTRGPCP